MAERVMDSSEQLHVHRAAGIRRRKSDGLIEVRGADRLSFLQGLVTNDVKALTPGRGCETAFLTVKGKVVTLMGAVATEEALFFSLPRAHVASMLSTLNGYLIMEDVEMTDASERFAVFAIQGPKTAELLASATELDQKQVSALLESKSYTAHLTAPVPGLADATMRVLPVSESLPGGVHVWVVASNAHLFYEHLLERGAGCDLRPYSDDAAEALRIEVGRPVAGVDATEESLLPEIPYEHLVSWTKGCYLGQEPVARVKHRGKVNRELTGVFCPAGAPAQAGATLASEGKSVGWLTSSAYSARLDATVALGFVRITHREPGTRLTLVSADGEDASSTATVAALPFESSHEGDIESR